MEKRLQLHNVLTSILGSKCVYFQPPPSFQMTYPCFRYELAGVDVFHANNMPYKWDKAYLVTYISYDPDDDMIEEMLSSFQHIRFDRKYPADGLYHYVYKIYY